MEIKDILINSIKSDRIAHAYLFEGPENSEKENTAELFAKLLLCDNLTGCGTCSNCLMFQNKSHPDYHYLSTDSDTIKIREHIEPFFKDIRLSSPYSGRKIYIINEAHKMNSASQNSILKILEEPYSDVVIVLVTQNSDLLLSTVLSRVIRYTFPSAEFEKKSGELNSIFQSIMNKIIYGSAEDRIYASTELSSGKDICGDLLDMMQIYYRDCLVAKYTNRKILINSDKTVKISSAGAIAAVKIVDEIKFALKSNVNIQLAMDVLVTKLHDVSQPV